MRLPTLDRGYARVMDARPRLLIADDDPVIKAVLERQFAHDFDFTDFAQDTDSAIAIAERERPDVVLLDVEMPGGGGLRAAQEIRRRSPGSAIVAFSSDESRQGVLDMLDAGAVAYVRKGILPADLAHKLHQALAAHRAMHADDA